MAEEILIMQGVGDFVHFEPFALIGNADLEARRGFGFGFFDDYADMDLFITVVAIAMHDGIDHTFANRHTDPVLIVFVKTGLASGFQDLTFGEIDALERGWVIVIEQCVRAWMQFHFSLAACKKRGISARSVNTKRYHKRPRVRKCAGDAGGLRYHEMR
jgi:hypothetical protein